MIEDMDGTMSILMRKLRFYSKIGVFDQERTVGNEFEVEVEIRYPAKHFERENLDSSINYADAYDIVSEVMKLEWKLVESAAEAITSAISERWQFVESVRAGVVKLAPPVQGIIGECGAEIFLKKV